MTHLRPAEAVEADTRPAGSGVEVEETRAACLPPAHITLRLTGALDAVLVDARLVRQVLDNLLRNAVKYSPPDAVVSCAVTGTANEIRLQVQDRGMGIPGEDQARLFNAFHRGRNVGNISGTGLGLVITREAVALHGGTIEVDSAVGVGTTMTVTLPRRGTVRDAAA